MENAAGNGERKLEQFNFALLSQFPFGLGERRNRLPDAFLEAPDLGVSLLPSLTQRFSEGFLPDLGQLCLKPLFTRLETSPEFRDFRRSVSRFSSGVRSEWWRQAYGPWSPADSFNLL
jgi:hypothetical protein